LSLRAAAERSGLSFPTAAKAMQALEHLGIVDEVTGQRRNRVYAYSSCLKVLNEGLEPL
jgi:ribosomal protein S25